MSGLPVDLGQHWDGLYARQQRRGAFTWSVEPSDFLVSRIPHLESLGLARLLDIGCGDGRNMVPFALRGFSVTGVDISETAIERARRNLQTAGCGGFRLIRAELSGIVLDRRYDLMLSTKMFKHTWNTEEILARVLPKLLPGGRFAFEFATLEDSSHEKCARYGRRLSGYRFTFGDGTPYRFYTRSQVERLLAGAARLEVRRVEYWDEPHSGLSTERHRHESWLALGRSA
jgi:cyclopropane fatty-acyl-phospholipid synthase-like methyltransferase